MAGIAGMGTPNSLKPVVPQEQLPQVQDLGMVDFPAAAPQEQQAQNQEIDYAALADQATADIDYSALADQALGQEAGQAPTEDPSQDPRGTYGLSSLAAQFEQAPTRLQASFATTDKEKKFVLDRAYGAENVRKLDKDADFEIKKDGKWRKFDSDNFELIGDTLDFAREAVGGLATEGATLLGLGAAGAETVYTGGAGAPAAPGIVAGARALGAGAGLATEDAIQAWYGIPRDQARSYAQEYALAATLGPIFGNLADRVGARIASRAASKASDALITAENKAMTTVDDIVGVSDELKKAGLITNVEGFDTALLPSQAAPLDINAKKTAEALGQTPKFQNFILKQGKMIGEGFDKIFDSIANFTGKKTDVGTGTGTINLIDNMEKFEGKLIGEFRDKAIEEAGDGLIPMPKTKEAVQTLMTDLGYAPGQKVEATDLAGKALIRQVDKFYNLLNGEGGRVSMKDLDTAYKEISRLTKPYWKRADDLTGSSLKTLWGAVRDDYSQGINVLLDEGTVNGFSKKSYQAALDRFSTIKNATSKLINVLKTDEISAEAFVNDVFRKGTNTLDKVNAVKTLIQNEQPEVWKDLVGTYFNSVIKKNTDLVGDVSKPLGKTDWGAAQKQILGLGDEVLNTIMGPDHKKLLTNMFKYADAAEKGGAKFVEDPKNVGFIKNILLSGKSLFAAGNVGVTLFDRLDKQKTLQQFISRDGVETLLRGIPEKEKGAVRNFLEKYSEYQTKLLSQNAAGQAVLDVGNLSKMLAKTTAKGLPPVLGREVLTPKPAGE